MTDPVTAQIQELVDRETRAWDTQDVDLLLSIFHPDFVWVWPSSDDAHDPARGAQGVCVFDAGRRLVELEDATARDECEQLANDPAVVNG